MVGFSSEQQYRDGFGPFPIDFLAFDYGGTKALGDAITPSSPLFRSSPSKMKRASY